MIHRWFWLAWAGLAGWACSGSEPSRAPTEVAVWRVAEPPILSVGVVEGDPDHEFAAVSGALRLDDGRIVIADGASRELRYFDAAGVFLSKTGGRGDGPGEFRFLARLYHERGDSLLAWDDASARLSLLGPDGAFHRLVRPDSISGDSVFPLDVFLAGRFWVEGGLRPEARARALDIIERLSVPTGPGFRVARVVGERLWIREPVAAEDAVQRWTVIAGDGGPAAVVEAPAGVELHDVGDDDVLGEWHDANDVNFVRLYTLLRTSETARVPPWLSTPPDTSLTRTLPSPDAYHAALRGIVVAQEMHFANHGAYTADVSALGVANPGGMTLHIVSAASNGWAVVGVVEGAARICAIAIGGVTPPGWMEGGVMCG